MILFQFAWFLAFSLFSSSSRHESHESFDIEKCLWVQSLKQTETFDVSQNIKIKLKNFQLILNLNVKFIPELFSRASQRHDNEKNYNFIEPKSY